MKRTMILVALSAVLALNAAPAMAEMTLQQIFDAMTVGGSSLTVPTDALVDGQDAQWGIAASTQASATMIIEIANNAQYNSFGMYDWADPTNRLTIFNGGAATGWKASIFVDTVDPTMFAVQLDDGLVATPPDPALYWVADFGSTSFGFYLEAKDGTVFYSDSSLNANEDDQMLAFRGNDIDQVDVTFGLNVPQVANPAKAKVWTSGEYVLAWEDVAVSSWGSNDPEPDYNDLVLMIESVVPVPVPGAVLLGVLGLSVAGARLRRRSR